MAPQPKERGLIRYRDVRRERWKYKLVDGHDEHTTIRPSERLAEDNGFVVLETDGLLRLAPNYAWDGPSGPSIDTPSFMRGSAVHDGLYQLMRLKLLTGADNRAAADELLYELCLEDGMWPLRARWVRFFVRRFGARRARAKLSSEPIEAP